MNADVSLQTSMMVGIKENYNHKPLRQLRNVPGAHEMPLATEITESD
jgi:hypothetical protein